MRGVVLLGTWPALTSVASNLLPSLLTSQQGLTKRGGSRYWNLGCRLQAGLGKVPVHRTPSASLIPAVSPLLLAWSAPYLFVLRCDWPAWLFSLPPSPINYCIVFTGTLLVASSYYRPHWKSRDLVAEAMA
ncbi:hypothetical protein, variant [Blastomyces dermatitidis ATCC 26199]|nr:hypothetical protein BDFG_07092 [Blastomyces dermatitidis ATCC 26199]EQL30406.1 hypothetical protein, variant [Blastomyces dermatitidis ATCC 26199]